MNCETFRVLMFDYVDGSLDGDDALNGFRAHFASCGECSSQLKMVEAQETILTALKRPKAPPTLWGRITSSIEDRRMLERLDRPRRSFGWVAAAAAVLVVTLAVYGIVGRSAPEDPGLRIDFVDVEKLPRNDATALRRFVPGYENPAPQAPLLDTLIGMK